MKLKLAASTSLVALAAASSAYAGEVWDYYVNGSEAYNESVVTFTAPDAGFYDITAVGAQGGGAFSPHTGGLGADLSAGFYLSAGEQLSIAVGAAGQYGGWSGGGGGGTFVVGPDGKPLLIAGGGGGASSEQLGYNASLTTSANSGTSPGQGGAGGAGYAGGGGGGGFYSSGLGGNGGGSWSSGLGGGGPKGNGNDYAFGGFGGGGGTQGAFNGGGGGGGGYSGGNGGVPPQISYYASGGGGGGGSFLAASGIALYASLYAAGGNGYVAITEESAAPEPASLGLLAAGLIGLGAARRRRKA